MKQTNRTYIGSNERASLIDLEIPTDFQGELILFVHGFMGFKDWGAWYLVQAFFVQKGFGFCKFNMSHNGGTSQNGIDFPDEEAFGLNRYSYELADIEQAIKWVMSEVPGVEKIRLVGHSRGGGAVILAGEKYAHSYPLASVHTWAAISDIGMRFPEGPELAQWKKDGVRYVKNGRTHQDLPQYYSLYEDFHLHEQELNIRRAVEQLNIPISIHHGDQDTSVPISEGFSLATWAKQPLQIIPGADHVFGAAHPWSDNRLPKELEVLCEQTFQAITFL
jgi:pimeloyl-ACP methyl ester carboxylesterase